MKLTHYIYISTALAMLSACNEDHFYTVGEAENFIMLKAGVADGMAKMQTRTGTRADGDPTFVAFQDGTKLTIRIDGVWRHSNVNKEDIKKQTAGYISGGPTTDSDGNTTNDTHDITFAEANRLYWDDYGTADPKNMSSKKNPTDEEKHPGNGRDKGLTIYGVAVNKPNETAPAPTIDGTDGNNWTNLTWEINADQKTNGWEKYDLLTSNNIREGSASDGADGTYKFNNRNDPNPGNLLKFTHAMSKVTVNLIAGEGFSSHTFEDTPVVTLKKFNVSGHVDIINKTTTATGSESEVTPKFESGNGASSTPAKYEAIVYPGRTLTESDELLELVADYNKYYVTTKALYDVIGDDKGMKQGVNYVLNITVNKTAVHVEATIVNWEFVTGSDAPKINVNKAYGETTNDFRNDFSVFRSAGNIDGTYLNVDDRANVEYSNPAYSMSPQLYWPTHYIHYYFRGVYPQINKKDNSDNKQGPEISTDPMAADFVHSDGKTRIKVANEAYRSGYYPSDLMIGMPRKPNGELDETCKVGHKDAEGNSSGGICATEGKINLNFRYVMSQVKVVLSSSDSESKDHVSFESETEVVITGGYKNGQIQLSDGVADFTEQSKYNYTMNLASDDNSTYTKYHDAIIPQSLDGVKFKIKVSDGVGSFDYYEIDIKEIEVQEQLANGEWSTNTKVSAWEPGKIYTYSLKITKTGVKIIATITDWINVKGSTTIWM